MVALTLGGLTAQTYFGLRSLDAQIVVLDNSLKLRRESLDIARARAASGLASELDVHQAQGALSDALVQRRDAVRVRALLERQLAQLSGKLDLKVAGGDLFALPVPPTPPAGLPSSLLERRPDIRAAEQSMVAANAQIGVARAARFPTVSLTGFLGGQSAAVEDIASSGVWSVGLGVAMPLFDAGRRAARSRTRRRRATGRASPLGRDRSRARSARCPTRWSTSRRPAPRKTDLLERVQAARNALELSQRALRVGLLAATSRCSTPSAPPTTPSSPSCATARRASPSAST